IFNEASLVVCDGEGVRQALRRQGHTVFKVPGIELIESLCIIGAERGWRVFLYGGEPRVAELASEVLAERYPRLVVVGALDGFH
ncbi:WecB/TagA/CpsF family glycosyltransferase, partial [Acinetobacter baumannii]